MRPTIAVFRANELLVTSFASILRKPEFQAALDALRDLGTPREFSPPDGVSFTEWNSHQNARREGFNQALDALVSLGTPNKPRKTDRDFMPDLVKED
jgi:hypothetical protein